MTYLTKEVLDDLTGTLDDSDLDQEDVPAGVIAGFDPESVIAIRDRIKGRFVDVQIGGDTGQDLFRGSLLKKASTLMFVLIPNPKDPGGHIPPNTIFNRALKGLAFGGTLVLDIALDDLGQLSPENFFSGLNCLKLPVGSRLLIWGQRTEGITGKQVQDTLAFLDDLGDDMVELPSLEHRMTLRGHDLSVFEPSLTFCLLNSLVSNDTAGDLMLNQYACKGIAVEQVYPLVPLKPAHQAMVRILGGLNREFLINGRRLAVYTAIRKRKFVEVTREEPGFKEEIETETPYLQVTIADLSSGEVYDLT